MGHHTVRAIRRTIRTAAVATGAVAAIALPVQAAVADAGPGSAARELVGTARLADGSVAKVYRLGQHRVEAEIWAGGAKLDTLVASSGRTAHGEHNGLRVELAPDGTVTSRGAGAAVAGVSLPGGRSARLSDGAQHGPRVELARPDGGRIGTLDARRRSATDDGWTYKIVESGKAGVRKFVVIDGRRGGSSWVYDFHGKLIEKYTVQDGRGASPAVAKGKGKKTATPSGGVRAGAEGAAQGTDPRTTSAPLVAAGGGIAALGAAGLGFAVLRRRVAED